MEVNSRLHMGATKRWYVASPEAKITKLLIATWRANFENKNMVFIS